MLLREKGEPDVAYRHRVRVLEDDRIVGLALAAMACGPVGPVAAAAVIVDQVSRLAST